MPNMIYYSRSFVNWEKEKKDGCQLPCESRARKGKESALPEGGPFVGRDFRIDWKKKYPLYEILMIAVCALIDGAKGPTDYERFGKAKIGLLKQFLRLENGIPSHDTFGRSARFARSASATSSQQTSNQWNKDRSVL